MTDEAIYDGLTLVLRDVFDDEGLVATPDLSAKNVEGWDSLAHINVIVSTEMRFGVKFTTTEVDGLRNLGDLARLIAAKGGSHA